jgi:hypothetical protein
MELLASISKKADGVDTRLAQLDEPMVMNTLAKYIGALTMSFTLDQTSQPRKEFAFIGIKDLLQEEVGGEGSSNEGA